MAWAGLCTLFAYSYNHVKYKIKVKRHYFGGYFFPQSKYYMKDEVFSLSEYSMLYFENVIVLKRILHYLTFCMFVKRNAISENPVITVEISEIDRELF